MQLEKIQTEVLIIGSGAGGALTAALLAEKGFQVTILEEGPKISKDNVTVSATEMMEKLYRRGGISPILGRPSVALVEGRCVGGGTEINSAIFHRTPDDVIRRWQIQYDIKELSRETLIPFFKKIEHDLSVTVGPPNLASEILKSGAEKLGWKGYYVPRAQKDCVDTNMCAIGCPTGAKQSMIVTYIPRALKAGAKLIPDCQAIKILTKKGYGLGVLAAYTNSPLEKRLFIKADYIFVCGGAIQTPRLLQKSKINNNIGKSFSFHPTVKVAGKFEQELNLHENAFPSYQVKEFSPSISMGGAFFSPSYIALVLKNNSNEFLNVIRYWRHMALYYTMTCCSGTGSVKRIPLMNISLPKYFLTKLDHENLSIGIAKLSELLLIAGAKEVYPDIYKHPPLKTVKECRRYTDNLIPLNRTNLYTIHIFGSCPMGEMKEKCAVDSFGKILGFTNIYINDASILPDATGVNPQGTIMAIAMRNVEHFISTLK